ncbi:MAG: ParA family protein [Ornithinimicrobium sp.]
MTVYTVALSKGGSTKTTTAAELIAALARAGRSVLAIDLDQQGNLTTRCGLNRSSEVEADAADVLLGNATITQAAVPAASVPGAHVIAGTHALAQVDARPEVVTVLRDRLPIDAGEWDDVVIDTPPALGLITLAALAAADVIVASVACEAEAYDQLDRLVQVTAQRVARTLRTGQDVRWIIPTRFDRRRLIDGEVVDLLNEKYPNKVTRPIREAVAAKDAYSAGQPVSAYAPTSGIANDYAEALAQIIGTDPSHETTQTNGTASTKETA